MTTPWDLLFGENNSKKRRSYAEKEQQYAEAYDELRKEHGEVWLKYRNIKRPRDYDYWRKGGNRYANLKVSGGSSGGNPEMPFLPPPPSVSPSSADVNALENNLRNIREAVNNNSSGRVNISGAGGADVSDGERKSSSSHPLEVITGKSGRVSDRGRIVNGRRVVSGSTLRGLIVKILDKGKMGQVLSPKEQQANLKKVWGSGGNSAESRKWKNEILKLFNEAGISFHYTDRDTVGRRGTSVSGVYYDGLYNQFSSLTLEHQRMIISNIRMILLNDAGADPNLVFGELPEQEPGEFADFSNIFEEKKTDIINAMTEQKIPKELATKIYEKLRDTGILDAENENRTTFSNVNDIADRKKKSMKKAIEKIINQEAKTNSKLKINFDKARKMILDIVFYNPLEDIATGNLGQTPRKIREGIKNAYSEEEERKNEYAKFWEDSDDEGIYTAYDDEGNVIKYEPDYSGIEGKYEGNRPDYSGHEGKHDYRTLSDRIENKPENKPEQLFRGIERVLDSFDGDLVDVDLSEEKKLNSLEAEGSKIAASLRRNRKANPNTVFSYGSFSVEHFNPRAMYDGGGDPDDPDGNRVVINYGGRRRIISVGALAILLGILGIAGKKIYERLRGDKKADIKVPDQSQEFKDEYKNYDTKDIENMNDKNKLPYAKEAVIPNYTPFDPFKGIREISKDNANNLIPITQQIKDAGLEHLVEQYNESIQLYEINRKGAITDPNNYEYYTSQMIPAMYNLHNLRDRISDYGLHPENRKNPQENLTTEREKAAFDRLLKSETDSLNQAQEGFLDAKARLNEAIANGANPSYIEDLYTNYHENRAMLKRVQYEYDTAMPFYKAAVNNKTHLPNRSDEVFPDENLDQVNKFKEIQQMENALKQYSENEKQDMGGALITYFESYNQRLNGIGGSKGIKQGDFKNKNEYYDQRLKILNTVFNEFKLDKPKIDKYTPETSLLDDPESNVELQDYDHTIDQGSGYARAETLDPAEARLFLNTSKEAREQQRMWDTFSRVEPGHGLGSMGYNTLRQHNLRSEIKRFTNTKKTDAKPFFVKTKAQLEREAPMSTQPMFNNIYQNDFGSVQMEDDSPNSNYIMSGHLTNERLKTTNYREWDNDRSIYHPELELSRYHRKPVEIRELRMNGYDYGLPNIKPSQQEGVLTSDQKTGYHYKGLMRNDIFNKKITKRNPTNYTERLTSSRF